MPGSLEDKIQRYGNVADMLRNVPLGAYAFPMKRRVQQLAGRAARLADDRGAVRPVVPHDRRLLQGPGRRCGCFSDLGVNSFSNFGKNKAKQFVACNYDGYVIGDAILFGLDDDEFSLVGRPSPRTGWPSRPRPATTTSRSPATSAASRTQGRRLTFRYQLQGPHALKVVEQAAGRPIARIKFFNIGEFEHRRGTRCGRSTTRWPAFPAWSMTGLEMTGPSEHGPDGAWRRCWRRARSSGCGRAAAAPTRRRPLESGLDPVAAAGHLLRRGDEAVPRVAERRRAGRPTPRSAAASSPTASRTTTCTPWDLGYGHVVKFDHDFIGRAGAGAAGRAARTGARSGCAGTTRTSPRVIASSLFGTGRERAKYLDMPSSNYATLPVRQGADRRPARRLLREHRLHGQRRRLVARSPWSTRRTRSTGPRSRWSGARRTAARPSRPSSATSRRNPGHAQHAATD